MNQGNYEYNTIENDIIYLKKEYKKKGKEYGIVELNKDLIPILLEAIDLMSVSPNLSSKFSEKIEKFITPRYLEINEIVFAEKKLGPTFKIEISKENHKEMLNAFTFPNVIIGLGKKGNALKELTTIMKNIRFTKLK